MTPSRSISCGLALLVITATPAADEPVEVIPPQNKALSANGQRYVFGQISQFRRDQYMLDTKTGRLWRKVCAKESDAKEPECLVYVLEPIPYAHADGRYSVLPP